MIAKRVKKAMVFMIFSIPDAKSMKKAMIFMLFPIYDSKKSEKGNDIHDIFDF